MDFIRGGVFWIGIFSLMFAFCGENTSEAPNGGTSSLQGLKALSVNESTVRLQWNAVQGIADSNLLGYHVSWSGRADTIPSSVLSYTVDSLSSGETLFNISVRLAGGGSGPAGTIRWAPAARFDAGLTLTEYVAQQPQRVSGLDLGGRTSDPTTLAVDPADPVVGQTLDLFLSGGEGAQPLALRSPHLLLGSWNVTAFSTVTHSSPSLDYPLERFPDAATFTLNSVTVVENTIVYARVAGNDGGTTHYVRIHVGATSGGGNVRSVLLRVSLQRVPALLFASDLPVRSLPSARAGELSPV